MVMIKLDGFIEDINGKLGGGRYRRDNCGYHWEELPEFWGNPTEAQKEQRYRFMAVMVYLKSLRFTQAETDQWKSYCSRHPRTNKKGEVYFLTPQLAFISVNINLLKEGKDMVKLPPPN